MDAKTDKPGVPRRELFQALVKRAVTEVKEGYAEALAAQNNAAAAKPNKNTPR